MSATDSRLKAALAAFDAANAGDPTTETVAGRPVPAALVYGQRMSRRLTAFAPDASEPLRLAVRAQHLLRWTIPRASYPAGRRGYHRWRTDLAAFHAEQAGAILRGVGYEEETVARVQTLLRKERLRWDPEVQTLEDVACLVFLEHHLGDFAAKTPEDKVVDILRKTWHKMSEPGHQAALALPLPAPLAALVARALGR